MCNLVVAVDVKTSNKLLGCKILSNLCDLFKELRFIYLRETKYSQLNFKINNFFQVFNLNDKNFNLNSILNTTKDAISKFKFFKPIKLNQLY